MADVRPAGRDQPRRDQHAEPRGVAEAIGLATREGVKFERRVNHGVTHSLYIVDPNGYGVEVLYELPREVWGDNIQGAIDYAEQVPTAGDEAFIDDTNYPIFGAGEQAAE